MANYSTLRGSGGSGGSSVTSYSSFTAFPTTGNTEADLAWAEDTDAMYVWDGTEWDRISTGNNMVPEFTTEPADAYTLAADGTATTITVAATDPEGFDITYSHDTSPSNQTQATITNNGGTFTITPSTDTANAGSFNLRFKASDGVHVSSKTSNINLGFITEWFGQYYGGYEVFPYDLAVDSNDNIYVVGRYKDTNTSSYIAYISKVDKFGVHIWMKTLEVTESSTTQNYFDSIAIDSNDNIYVVGNFYDGDERAVVVKYNTAGTVQFAKKYYKGGSSSNLTPTAIAITPNGNSIFFAWRGASLSHGQTVTTIFKINSSGATQWRQDIENTADHVYDTYNTLVATDTLLYTTARTEVTNDTPNSSYRYSGIIALNVSDGALYGKQFRKDVSIMNQGSREATLYYDDSDNTIVAMYRPYGNNWPSMTSSEYGLGIFSLSSTLGTNTNTTSAFYPTDATVDIWADTYEEGGKVVKNGSTYYRIARYNDSDILGTVGYYSWVYGLQKASTTSVDGWYLYCPSNTSGGGISPCSLAKTSDGKTIALVRIQGDATSSGTYRDMGLVSVDMSQSASTYAASALGVNSNITLASGRPPNLGTTTTGSASFTSSVAGGTLSSSSSQFSFTESTLSNTAADGPTITRDYEDLS